ncbi:Pnap_2097 family protein, partial [Pararobbsia alpina]|uniref:Pnap_2097 family protein n=1 Tax=Pararobbsia alpina TaxID=621374 RepID=UPI0031B5D651
MPQLAYTGLSENWLLKECGHRHWEALAGDTGRRAPDFVDDHASKSYAAFTAIRLTGATLDAIDENDDFELGTGLCRTGPARHFSRHRLLSAFTQWRVRHRVDVVDVRAAARAAQQPFSDARDVRGNGRPNADSAGGRTGHGVAWQAVSRRAGARAVALHKCRSCRERLDRISAMS